VSKGSARLSVDRDESVNEDRLEVSTAEETPIVFLRVRISDLKRFMLSMLRPASVAGPRRCISITANLIVADH
jgi:hypothetical protein